MRESRERAAVYGEKCVKSFCLTRALGLFLVCSVLHAAAFIAQSANDIAQGLQLLRSGHAVEAKTKFDAAVKQAPRSADALTWRGICENQLQQYEAAAADFETALRFDRAMLPAHYNLALTLIRLHKTDAAIEQLRIVVAAQPSAVQPLYNLAILLESKGSFAEAAEQLRAAHLSAPQDKGVTLHLLTDSLKSGHIDELSPLVRDLEDYSTEPAVEIQAGTALLEASRFSDAIPLLKAARDRDSSAPGIDLLLARALLGNGQNAEAIALLEAMPSETDVSEEKMYLLALGYLGEDSIAKAAAIFEAAAKLDPKDARPLYHLGLLEAVTPHGRPDSLRLLRAASALDPTNTEYALALARVLLADDQAEEARAVLEKSPSASADQAQRLALMGVALAASHQVAEAVPQLKDAIERDPTLALAQNVLGFCYLEQGEYRQAAEAYGKASELEPRRALYARDAALAYERANLSEQAMHFAERANALDGANAGDHALLGKLYSAAGRNEDAVRELLRAAELNPDLDSAYYLLARTYQQMGDRKQAVLWSEKLSVLKQQHEAAFAVQKKQAATEIRSSTLLEGGSLGADQAGVP